MFRRRWFSSPKTERRYFFSTNQGSCDIYADGVYVGRYLGTGITEFTYSTSRNYINISLVGISLPDQVYNYTNGISPIRWLFIRVLLPMPNIPPYSTLRYMRLFLSLTLGYNQR